MNKRKEFLTNIKRNLFASPIDSCITVTLLLIVSWVLFATIHWILFVADWRVVSENIDLYTYGSYPKDQGWRPRFWIGILVALSVLTIITPRRGYLRKVLTISWISMIPLGPILLAGGLGLKEVPSHAWGGLSLTVIITICSASIAIPLGTFLALGRLSKLAIINRACRTYIDVMRAIPLIAVLFFGQLLIPLFLPMDVEVNRVLRAILAFALFTSAYIAEDIRGGLQTVSQTQKEAAAVLGLSPRQITTLVVLPQAFRTALPALTNQAIGLIQNTSLMALLGLVELLGISRSLLANPAFIGRYLEVYIWLAALYWFVCTAMALLSRNLEHQLNPISTNK